MTLKMMDRKRRNPQRKCEGRPDARTDEQRPSQPGSGRVGNRVQVADRKSGLIERLADQRDQAHDMIARCQFGHDTAIGSVHVHLTVERLTEQAGAHPEDGHPRLVAGRLDAQDRGVPVPCGEGLGRQGLAAS